MSSPMKWAAHHCSKWVVDTYGQASFDDKRNRAARVAEEGIELGQAEGVDQVQAQAILDRVYSRPVGQPRQEAAGVLFTLIVYAKSAKIDLWRALNAEYKRVTSKDPMIFRMKQREKFAAGTDLVQPI